MGPLRPRRRLRWAVARRRKQPRAGVSKRAPAW